MVGHGGLSDLLGPLEVLAAAEVVEPHGELVVNPGRSGPARRLVLGSLESLDRIRLHRDAKALPRLVGTGPKELLVNHHAHDRDAGGDEDSSDHGGHTHTLQLSLSGC